MNEPSGAAIHCRHAVLGNINLGGVGNISLGGVFSAGSVSLLQLHRFGMAPACSSFVLARHLS